MTTVRWLFWDAVRLLDDRPRAQAIVIARSFGVTLGRLGEAFGVSRENIRQNEVKAWRVMRARWVWDRGLWGQVMRQREHSPWTASIEEGQP